VLQRPIREDAGLYLNWQKMASARFIADGGFRIEEWRGEHQKPQIYRKNIYFKSERSR
jgi:hypothetical protein